MPFTSTTANTYGFEGRKHTPEARAKMAEAHRARCADPTVKAVWRKTPAARSFWYVHSKPWLRKAAKEDTAIVQAKIQPDA